MSKQRLSSAACITALTVASFCATAQEPPETLPSAPSQPETAAPLVGEAGTIVVDAAPEPVVPTLESLADPVAATPELPAEPVTEAPVPPAIEPAPAEVAPAEATAPPAAAEIPVFTAADLGLTDDQLKNLLDGRSSTGGSPGVSFGSPVGFGASWGSAGVGIGGSTEEQNDGSKNLDGSASLVLGLGDSQRTIGAEVTLNIISLKETFGEDSSVSTKLHRSYGNGSFAVGVDNIIAIGEAKKVDESIYAAYSHVFTLPSGNPLVVGGGLGNNRFSNARDGDGIGAFGSVAVFLTSRVSLIADVLGRGFASGVSFVPLAGLPLTVTVGAVNLLHADDVKTEFSGGIGYSQDFK